MLCKPKKTCPFDIIILCIAAYTSFATSYIQNAKISTGQYSVKSDCPGSKSSGEVTVSYDSETQERSSSTSLGPRIKGGQDYGLPSELVTSDGPHRVRVQGQTRICDAIELEKMIMFACYNAEGALECTVTLEARF